jgi:hypothetical protein
MFAARADSNLRVAKMQHRGEPPSPNVPVHLFNAAAPWLPRFPFLRSFSPVAVATKPRRRLGGCFRRHRAAARVSQRGGA